MEVLAINPVVTALLYGYAYQYFMYPKFGNSGYLRPQLHNYGIGAGFELAENYFGIENELVQLFSGVKNI